MRLRRRTADQPVVVCGSGSRRLGAAICAELGVQPAVAETVHFGEGTIFVRLLENVRGRDVYVVQSTIYPANDNVVELLFWLDACRRASAASVTAVVPYFSYGKGDKKDEPRVSIRARVCADAMEAAGVDRVVAMDDCLRASHDPNEFLRMIGQSPEDDAKKPGTANGATARR